MNRFLFVFAFLLFLDWYVFRAFRNQFSLSAQGVKIAIYSFYWLIPALLIGSAIYISTHRTVVDFRSNRLFIYLGAMFVLFYVPKLIILFFQAIEDLTKIIAWITKKLSPVDSKVYTGANGISRSLFISRMGLIISAIPFASLLYGIVIGRFNFRVNTHKIYFDNLPKAFDGFKIVQFSDLHTGSLIGQQDEFKKAFEMINRQNADVIVFTGDIVNNIADEVEDWIELLSTLKAKNGQFSILGNHDYGEYFSWKNEDEKMANLDKLKKYHSQIGFNLMLNTAHVFEREGEKIALLGIENWGEKPFPQYGRLDIAMEKAADIPFKVLLSHDPTHWEYQVLKKTDIALTLSGHTHGMQMALNIGNYSWSPVSLKYKRWKGLYTENNQHLYVNIGLGYIGFPGRVGTDPEITVFELKAKG